LYRGNNDGLCLFYSKPEKGIYLTSYKLKDQANECGVEKNCGSGSVKQLPGK